MIKSFKINITYHQVIILQNGAYFTKESDGLNILFKKDLRKRFYY